MLIANFDFELKGVACLLLVVLPCLVGWVVILSCAVEVVCSLIKEG